MSILYDFAFIFVALFALGFTIFIHELGYFLAARQRGLVILRFSIDLAPNFSAGPGMEWNTGSLPSRLAAMLHYPNWRTWDDWKVKGNLIKIPIKRKRVKISNGTMKMRMMTRKGKKKQSPNLYRKFPTLTRCWFQSWEQFSTCFLPLHFHVFSTFSAMMFPMPN